jgi:hypothetical protein
MLRSSAAPGCGADGNTASLATNLPVFSKGFTSFLLMKNCTSGVVSTRQRKEVFWQLEI